MLPTHAQPACIMSSAIRTKIPRIALLVPLCVLGCDEGDRATPVATLPVQGTPIDAPLEPKPIETGPKGDASRARPDVDLEEIAASSAGTPLEEAQGDPSKRAEPSDELESFTAKSADEPDDSVLAIDFADLAFDDYEVPELRDSEEAMEAVDFPIDAAELDGRRVTLAGFMLVANFEEKRVTSFMFGRFPPGCCFGAIPRYDEWMIVAADELETDDFSPYEMITVTGRLEVGEALDEEGFVQSLYRLQGEAVESMW